MARIVDEHCTQPPLGEALTPYCFGELPEPEQDQVEQHLLECDACWTEFQGLDVSVQVLRFAADAQPPVKPEDIVSQLGLSSRLTRPFGGHRIYVLAMALLYGLEWTVGLWSELGYSYARFGALAWALSGPVAASVMGAVILSLWADSHATRVGKFNGLGRSLAIIISALGVLTVGLMVVLPEERTILASFQTRTASGGYFKDALLLFLPLLLFIVPPFHTIVALQRELTAGRHEQILKLLARAPDSFVPRGTWYLSPRFLTGFLLFAGTLKIVGANHMLDALTPGPYANLFTVASYISTALWFAIAILALTWYSSRLNDVKREAVAFQRFLTRK